MSDFSINFGSAKPMVLPEEGTYTLTIQDYKIKEANKEESRSKGFNVSLVFSIDDPEFSNIKVFHNLWCAYDNPWAAKLFFEALTGKILDDDSLNIQDEDYFIGERVGAALIHETYEGSTGQTKTKLSIASPDSFYTVD